MNEKLSPPFPPTQSNAQRKLLTYALIDCAHFEENFYAQIIAKTDNYTKSLFEDTPYKTSIVAAPLLVQLDIEKDQHLISHLQEIEKKFPAVVWLWSESTFGLVFKQLNKLLFAKLPDGNQFFLRYYDPRCIEEFLNIFKKDNYAKKSLEYIKTWAFYRDDVYHYLDVTTEDEHA